MGRSGLSLGYSKQAIQERLEALVFLVMTRRRTLSPTAEALTVFCADRLDLIVEQVRQITETSIELAYHVARAAPRSLRVLADDELPGWTLSLLETYDRQGIQGCINALADIEAFAERTRQTRRGRRFEEVAPVLEPFITGLAGRNLGLAVADVAGTDTQTVFLPPLLAVLPDRAGNFLLYKAMAAFCWAQTWYGTWRIDTATAFAGFTDHQRALAGFAALETVRLGACLARDLPGLWRQIQALQVRTDPVWEAFAHPLRASGADVGTSLALRGEDRLLRRQAEGEAPDIDAIIDAYADMSFGLEPDHRLFCRKQRSDRNIAVLFMVDMSGSTKGWINEVERESLVLLCEPLGDRYAIYGFSGYTHLRCEVFAIKAFAEGYSAAVKSRIAGIGPRDYTRMGAAIRHLSNKLLAVDARTRVLIALSDGRPDDEDGYRGDYGIEDTRQAVLEARTQGVHPFCITIDDQAQDYLPHLFGRTHFTVVEDVAKLPYKVSDIYRKITS